MIKLFVIKTTPVSLSVRFKFTSLLLFTITLMCSPLITPQQANATLAGFKAGNIMSDAVMGNTATMSEAQIQSFLDGHASSCTSKGPYSNGSYYIDQLAKTANGTKAYTTDDDGHKWVWNIKDGHFVCMADATFKGGSAAHIIYGAAQDYDINPQVLIVLLQKEQGLVMDAFPNNHQYLAAAGFNCPDNGNGCNNDNAGFKEQIRLAARLFHEVLVNRDADGDGFITNYPVGNNYIQYNPADSCGGKTVNIENRATSALYRYTPYQPNKAALDAGFSTGDSCSAYGNRNFYNYFTEWFGNTRDIPYTDLKTPRWMSVKSDTQKVDLRKVEPGSYDLSENQQIYFSTKAFIDGVWYLRTKHDSNLDIDVGVALSDLEDIPATYSDTDSPKWMQTTKEVYKQDPITGQALGDPIPAGTQLFFPSSIEIGGALYVRTQADTQNGVNRAISDDTQTLKDFTPAYTSFKYPRWMVTTRDTQEYDLKYPSASTSPLITAGTVLYLDYSTRLNDHSYATHGAPAADTFPGINLDYLRNISADDFSSLRYQRAYTLNENLQKTDISNGQSVGAPLSKDMAVYFQTLTHIGDDFCLRTAHDTTLDATTCIPLTKVTPVDVSFQPMKNPRQLQLREDLQKIDPVTLQRLDSILKKGRSIAFSETITIGVHLYLRTQADASHGQYKVIPYSLLKGL